MPNQSYQSESELLGDITADTPEFNANIRPATKFRGDIKVHDSDFLFQDSLDFTTSFIYAGPKGPHQERLYHYSNSASNAPSFTPIVPSRNYLNSLEESWDGVIIIDSNKTKTITSNDNWIYHETDMPKFQMSAKMELDFQKLFRDVNSISAKDFALYSPEWLSLSMNSACSKELQCLAWSYHAGKAEYERQRQDFAASILRVWNSGLLGYYSRKDNKRVVQRVENTQVTSKNSNPFA